MATKRAKVTMRDRYKWLKAWLQERNYDIGSKQNEFLYIFYSTVRSIWSANVSRDLLRNINNQFANPLEDNRLDRMIQRVNAREVPNVYRNEDIIRRLGITAEEADKLRIGYVKKEREERAEKIKADAARKKDIEMMYGMGYTTAQIHEKYPEISTRTIKRYISAFRRKARTEQEQRVLAETVIHLYQEEHDIKSIARQTGSTMEEVSHILGLTPMTNCTTLEKLQDIDEEVAFKVSECAELFTLSRYREQSTQSGLNDQAIALATLRTFTGNIVVLGAAGTGKTYLIKEYLSKLQPKEREKTLIVAPTGRAADNLDAQTIHKVFCFPNDVQPNKPVTDAPKKLYTVSRIIIDEINLVRLDVFERMVKTIRFVEEQTNRKIQILAFGDFGQIQPVAAQEDIEAIRFYYPNTTGVYAFQSELWDELKFRKIILRQVHRQKDIQLIEKLTEIKYGKLSALQWFNDNATTYCDPKAIYICPTNKLVKHYNDVAIEWFATDKLYEFTAKVIGGNPTEELPCPERIKLAVGMRVMTICNAAKYKNGSMGVVTEIHPKTIQVKFDNGVVSTVRTKKFALQNGVFFEQIPVVLAYAITANKAEGMTFSAINVVPGYFAAGQLYTALSRCKNIARLHIVGKLSAKDLVVDLAALRMTVE